MKKALKYLGFALAGLIVLFLFVANFSATEKSFACSGTITKENISQGSKTVFIKLTEYRPWVGLWSDSSGSVHLEIPNEWYDYFDHVEVVGDQLQIFDSYPQKTIKGNFSTLSNALAIDTPAGLFEGNCVAN